MEILVVAICTLVCGIDDFVGVEDWLQKRIDWLRRFLKLENEIPSHDTLGRLEVRRCRAFDQLECLANPQHWPDLKMFGVIEAERTINGKTRWERRL